MATEQQLQLAERIFAVAVTSSGLLARPFFPGTGKAKHPKFLTRNQALEIERLLLVFDPAISE